MNAPASTVIPAGKARAPPGPGRPVVGLLGLVASAGFAVWTGLTCFVC